jgi:hypothetical protein
MKNLIKSPLFLFALVAIFFVSNFININVVFATVENIDKIIFTTESQTIGAGIVSGDINIQTQNSGGLPETLNETADLTLISTSATGEFSSSATSWTADNILTMNNTWANRKFYYKDGSTGTFIITANLVTRVTGRTWTATHSIIIGDSGNTDDSEISTTTATTTDSVTATTTTATTTSTSTATTTITNVTTVVSVHYIQQDISDYEEPTNIFEVTVGRDRLSYVGSPVSFEAKYKTSNDLKNRAPKYNWSFGDGSVSLLKEVTHTYKYAGDYNVVLNANLGEVNSISRAKVKILIPDLVMSVTIDGEAQVLNNGNNEINLFGLKIKSNNNEEYSFPMDTILSAKSSVIFPSEYLGISKTNRELSLVDSTGKIMSQIKANQVAYNPDKLVTYDEFEKFALEYQRLAQIEKPIYVATVPAYVPPKQNSQPFVNNVSHPIQTNSNIPLTASVGSIFIKSSSSAEVIPDESNNLITENVQRGFWGKIFHPIQTIREAFYE